MPRTAAGAMDPRAWVIGPIIRGRNYSVGMPLHPSPRRDGAWHIDLPRAPGSVHYVTFPHGSLAGKRRISMRYRVEAAPGARLAPTDSPGATAILSLYFQRRGDSWNARGPYEHYRWYATPSNRVPLAPGEHEISLTLDGRNWKSVMSMTGADAPAQFRDALGNAEQVGFVLGGGSGAGHGVSATGPARIVVTDFRVD